jgi:Spy/CpxP family protein refolding chaperone
MKRSLILVLVLLLPAMIFAQGMSRGLSRMGDENGLLKSFGLNEAQIAQATTIEKSTRDAVRADFTHIKLVQAQIAEALLPATPDANAINALIEKKGLLRTDIAKSLMSARIQLVKIMGNENYAKFARFVMGQMRSGFGRGAMMGRFGGGMMGQQGKGPRSMRIAPMSNSDGE